MSLVHVFMLSGGLLLGAAAGFVMHRSGYCVAGMFRDLFMFRSTLLLKSLILLLAVSLPLFELIHLSGFVALPFPFFGPPSLANLLGGLLFGIGMVLAGGCVVGTLYKLGSGSFPALLALAGLVGGSTLYAFFHPTWAVFAKAVAFPTRAVTLSQLLLQPPWLLVVVLEVLLIPLLFVWFRQRRMERPAVVASYLQPWKAALLLALIGTASVLLVGMPLGITTSYSKMGAFLLQLVMPDVAAGVSYFKLLPLNYTPPLGGGVLVGGPGAAFDGVALVQYPLIIGIIVGSALSALLLGEWRMHFGLPWRQAVSVLLGGVIMGLASRMAPACNIWHLFGGLPILALQSMLFLLGLLPGVWLGGLLLTHWVMPADIE